MSSAAVGLEEKLQKVDLSMSFLPLMNCKCSLKRREKTKVPNKKRLGVVHVSAIVSDCLQIVKLTAKDHMLRIFNFEPWGAKKNEKNIDTSNNRMSMSLEITTTVPIHYYKMGRYYQS